MPLDSIHGVVTVSDLSDIIAQMKPRGQGLIDPPKKILLGTCTQLSNIVAHMITVLSPSINIAGPPKTSIVAAALADNHRPVIVADVYSYDSWVQKAALKGHDANMSVLWLHG